MVILPAMKTAISIPDELFRAADRAAARLGLSRSQLYQRAIARFLEKESASRITEALDELYGSAEAPALDPVLDRMQRAGLHPEPW